MIRVVHPVSRIRMLTFYHPGSPIPDPGVKKAPDPGSLIRIRNTAGNCRTLLTDQRQGGSLDSYNLISERAQASQCCGAGNISFGSRGSAEPWDGTGYSPPG
jgi:hypothetical protein